MHKLFGIEMKSKNYMVVEREKMNDKILYDNYHERNISIKFLFFLQIIIGVIFILIGFYYFIFYPHIFFIFLLLIISISCGLIIIFFNIFKIIKWQNLKINENGIFLNERSFSDVLDKKNNFLQFSDIKTIINPNSA